MKSSYLFTVLLLTGISFSCKKDPVKSPATPPSDIQTVLLKDVVIQALPSPYYHFDYNDSGYITKAAYSSGFKSYDILYASRRISEIKSTHAINKDKLVYQYENGKVSLVKYFNEAGENYKRCFLSYNVSGLPEEMEWEIKLDAPGFTSERTLSFTYHPDGNLHELKDKKHFIAGRQNESACTDKFEDYDNKVNVDGFMLIHANNDHLILLPGVKWQKNNPRRAIRTGDLINYEIDYTYTYNELNKPVFRNGDMLLTTGTDAGQRFQSHTSFSYYP
ncbi:MAG: hypothetical protein WDO16_15465 [Bacteroidota bacterium]